MTTGRTTLNNWRVYVDGYDMSGYSRSFGPLATTFDEGVDDAVTLPVKAALVSNAQVGMGTLNGLFDNTATSGLHVIMSGAGVERDVMIPAGIQAAPVNNDPVFCGTFTQLGYMGEPDNNPVYATIPFSGASPNSPVLMYKPWGALLHAKAARTAANTATGLDQLASSTKGGWMMYQVFAGNGTAALKVQHASTNSDGSFSDLISSGTIACTSPIAGAVALSTGATVNRYVRWQIALGTATSVTFAIAFIRGTI